MFTVYHSNQVDVLKTLLVELIKLKPLANPFDAEQILVQSPGMSQWLKMEMAQSLGVAANVEFPLPATFIWKMFTQILDDVPERSAFNKEAMTWKLMHLLPQQLDKPEFAPLRHYLGDDEDQNKRFQLAEKIADTFDAYLVYRPEWIEAWEKGEQVDALIGDQEWQPLLWKELFEHTASLGQSPYHRANLYQDFIERLSRYKDLAQNKPENLPERLFVFGVSALPPKYLESLRALGEHIDVHFMLSNPCRYYWGDVQDRAYLEKIATQKRIQDHVLSKELLQQSEPAPLLKASIDDYFVADKLLEDEQRIQANVGNSLLASWGKLGRDNLYLLSKLEPHEIDVFIDQDPSSLLKHIQRDILDLTEPRAEVADTNPIINTNDSSLQIHVCHSAMREVEVLYDRLLSMFADDPELKPRDIIVMVADINAYSHAIQAVFGSAPKDRFIPFAISDRSVTQENPILQAFLTLLILPQGRYPASAILDLLEVPAIMERFELSADDHEKLSYWVEQSGIRWGLDDETAQAQDLPVTHSHTWQFGLDRILLGYAMPQSAGLFTGLSSGLSVNSDEIDTNNPIAPFDEIQGDNAELAGKLAKCVNLLRHYRDAFAQTQSIEQWQHHILALLEDFFAVDEAGEVVLHTIRQSMSQLKQQLDDAVMKEDLSPPLVIEYLQDRLSNSRVSQRFLAGQVNFCTLMPMRSIPFHTVCLLGMNDGTYPRTVLPERLDLIQGRTKQGDRSRREDDRYLFLEALLAAQNTLYISYVGQSIQDNSPKSPSVLVSELLDYCTQNYLGSDSSIELNITEQISFHHPLVPYSPSAFDAKNKAIQSYADQWLPAVNITTQGEIASVELSDDFSSLSPYWKQDHSTNQLDLVDLQRFWRLPVAYFFNHRLNTYFDDLSADSASRSNDLDDEPFNVSGLAGYQLDEELLQRYWQTCTSNNGVESQSFNDIADQYLIEQKAQGRLPSGAFAQVRSDQAIEKVLPLTQALQAYRGLESEKIEVDLDLPFTSDENSNSNKKVSSCHFTGWIDDIYKAERLCFRTGSLNTKTLLKEWIAHLAMNASGVDKQTALFGIDSKSGLQAMQFNALNSEQAKSYLAELIALYYQGLDRPLCFSAETAMKGLEAASKEKSDDKKINQAMKKAYLGDDYTRAENQDPYLYRLWKDWNDEMKAQQLEFADKILKPLLDNMQENSEALNDDLEGDNALKGDYT